MFLQPFVQISLVYRSFYSIPRLSSKHDDLLDADYLDMVNRQATGAEAVDGSLYKVFGALF
jgi:hypothetical protein